MPLWNGSVDPVVQNSAVDFAAAPTPLFNSVYFFGGAYLGSSLINGVTSVGVDTGISFTSPRVDGQVFASRGAISQRLPTFTFTTLNVNAAATVAMFNGSTGGTFSLQLGKGVNAAARATGSNFIRISSSAGAWNKDSMSVTDNGDATVSITVNPTGVITVAVDTVTL